MTYLFIIPSITNYFTFLEDIAGQLQEDGHQVLIATSLRHISEIECYDRGVNGELLEVDFPRGFEFFSHLKAARTLDSIVQKYQPDMVYVHFSAALFTTAIAKKKGWPITIGMMHGMAHPLLKGWKKWAIGKAERWSANQMDLVMLLNEEDKDILARHMPSDRIYVTESYGLGCDIKKFDSDHILDETKIRFHRRLSVREDDFVYIFVGRQVDFKGFDKLVKAFLQLFEDHKSLKLLLVGAKDNIHPTNLTEEEEIAMKRCPGIIDVGWKENVHEYLTVADVNVFPSNREGMPVNLMESIAMGVPVITTDSRGCREVVDDGVTGILVKSNDVAHVRDTMLDLYLNPEKLATMKDNCLKKRQEFDRQIFIEEQLEIFKHFSGKMTDLDISRPLASVSSTT